MKKTIVLIMLASAVILAIAIVALRGKNAESIIDRYPVYEQVHIDSSITHPLLREKILGQMLPPDKENAANFCAVKVFSSEKISESDYYVYAWVFESVYSDDGGVLSEDGGASYPCRFELNKENDTFRVTAAEVPGDGAQYNEDIKKLFPEYVREEIYSVQDNGTVKKLGNDTLAQAEEYFGVK